VDCHITRLSRNKSLSPLNGLAEIEDVSGSITDPRIWNKVLSDIDVIYHLAGQTSLYEAERNPLDDFSENVMPMLLMLETCRQKKIKPVIVFSGTVTQVGLTNRESPPIDESQQDDPISIYDIHKKAAETYLKHYDNEGHVYGITLRLPNIYGPGPVSSSGDRGVINKLLRKALSGESIAVFGSGKYLRDYLYIDDLISAFLLSPVSKDKLVGGYFILGTGVGYTVEQSVHLIAERVGRYLSSHVNTNRVEPQYKLHPIEYRNFTANATKFSNLTGWYPHWNFIDGLDKTIRVFQNRLTH